MSPSQDYQIALDLAKRQHVVSKNYTGKFLRPHRYRIKEIIDRLGCKTVLDYGAGRGLQYEWRAPVGRKDGGKTLEEFWGIEVTKYDPAYPPFAAEPTGTFDLILCTHVLGIIPIPDLEWVVDRIYGLANKAVYVVLNTGATQKRNKRRFRVENIPSAWGADEWIDLLTRRRIKGLEVQFIARPGDPNKKSGLFIITDTGMRGPL